MHTDWGNHLWTAAGIMIGLPPRKYDNQKANHQPECLLCTSIKMLTKVGRQAVTSINVLPQVFFQLSSDLPICQAQKASLKLTLPFAEIHFHERENQGEVSIWAGRLSLYSPPEFLGSDPLSAFQKNLNSSGTSPVSLKTPCTLKCNHPSMRWFDGTSIPVFADWYSILCCQIFPEQPLLGQREHAVKQSSHPKQPEVRDAALRKSTQEEVWLQSITLAMQHRWKGEI